MSDNELFHVARLPQPVLIANGDILSVVHDRLLTAITTEMAVYDKEGGTVLYQMDVADIPAANERILMYGRVNHTTQQLDNGFKLVPWISDSESDPKVIKPLREIISPRIIYNPASNEMILWFWTNFKSDVEEYDPDELVLIDEDALVTAGELTGDIADSIRTLCVTKGKLVQYYITGGVIENTSSEDGYDLIPIFDKPEILQKRPFDQPITAAKVPIVDFFFRTPGGTITCTESNDEFDQLSGYAGIENIFCNLDSNYKTYLSILRADPPDQGTDNWEVRIFDDDTFANQIGYSDVFDTNGTYALTPMGGSGIGGSIGITGSGVSGDYNIRADYTIRVTIDKRNDDNNQIDEYWNITGLLNFVDSNNKVYIKIVFVDPKFQIEIYKDDPTVEANLIGHSDEYDSADIGTTIPINEDNGSGLGGTIKIDAVVAEDDDVYIEFRVYQGTVQLNHWGNVTGLFEETRKETFLWIANNRNYVIKFFNSDDRVDPDNLIGHTDYYSEPGNVEVINDREDLSHTECNPLGGTITVDNLVIVDEDIYLTCPQGCRDCGGDCSDCSTCGPPMAWQIYWECRDYMGGVLDSGILTSGASSFSGSCFGPTLDEFPVEIYFDGSVTGCSFGVAQYQPIKPCIFDPGEINVCCVTGDIFFDGSSWNAEFPVDPDDPFSDLLYVEVLGYCYPPDCTPNSGTKPSCCP